MNQEATNDQMLVDTATDGLDALRAEGNAAPRSWGFLREAEREAQLRCLVERSLANLEPIPAWAVRECQRLHIRVR